MTDSIDPHGTETSISSTPSPPAWTSISGVPADAADVRTTISGGAHHMVEYTPGDRVTLRRRDIEIVRLANRAGEAYVYEVTSGGERFALKIYKPGHIPAATVLDSWMALRHPNVLELMDHGQVLETRATYELLPWYAGGSLREYFKRKGEIRDLDHIRTLVASIAAGLHVFHDVGIYHRDLKPDNVLLSKRDVLDSLAITDLGVASVKRALDDTSVMTGTMSGTDEYLAPEQWLNFGDQENPSFRISSATDYYALGEIVLEAWLGRRPFATPEGAHPGAVKAYKAQGVHLPLDLPPRLRILLKGLLAVEPARRYGHTEVQAWLRGEALVELADDGAARAYPPIQFRQASGASVTVTSPAQMADLFALYPQDATRFLYGWNIKGSPWASIDPGLCDVLRQVVEDDYPKDQPSGVTKAMHLLDPSRAYASPQGKVLHGYALISAELARDPQKTAALATSAPHSIWIYLETRPDASIVSDAKKFRAAIQTALPPEAPERVAAFLAWLQCLEGQKGCLDIETGRILDVPADLAATPASEHGRLAQRLADTADPLGLWIARQSPALARSIGRFRNAPRADAIGMGFALDAGAMFADGSRFLEPQDLFDARQSAHWGLSKGALERDALDAWFLNHREVTVPSLGLAWLATRPESESVLAVCDRVIEEWEATGRPLAEVVGVVLMALAQSEWTAERSARIAETLRGELPLPRNGALTGADRVRQLIEEASRWPDPARGRWNEVLGAIAPDLSEVVRNDYLLHAKAPQVVAEVHASRLAAVKLLSAMQPDHPLVKRLEAEESELERVTTSLAKRVGNDRNRDLGKVRKKLGDDLAKLVTEAVAKFDKTKAGEDLSGERAALWIFIGLLLVLGMGAGIPPMANIALVLTTLVGLSVGGQRGSGWGAVFGGAAGLGLGAALLTGMRALLFYPWGIAIAGVLLAAGIAGATRLPRKRARLIEASVDDHAIQSEYTDAHAKLQSHFANRFESAWWELRARLATESDPTEVNP